VVAVSFDGVFASMAAFAKRPPGESFPWTLLAIGVAGIAAGWSRSCTPA